MFGRTTRIAFLLIASQFASGCCCCEHPFFWRKCCRGCEQPCPPPCTTCCGSPGMPTGAMAPHGMPMYGPGPITMPAATGAPVVNPQADRMQPISSTALNGSR
jgi:hypothetical protein